MKLPVFKSVTVNGNKKAQEILSFFIKKARNADELKRFSLAKSLCDAWVKEKIPFSLPAVPKRQDYWYLAQILFLSRHVHKNRVPYTFHFEKTETIFLEAYEVKSIKKPHSVLIKLLMLYAKNKKSPYIFSRAELDDLLESHQNLVLSDCNVNPKEFKIVPMPFDIYLRLPQKYQLSSNIFFDGYRLRQDRKITGFYGGDTLFGGISFIDSLWLSSVNTSVFPLLVILRKEYGL